MHHNTPAATLLDILLSVRDRLLALLDRIVESYALYPPAIDYWEPLVSYSLLDHGDCLSPEWELDDE